MKTYIYLLTLLLSWTNKEPFDISNVFCSELYNLGYFISIF